MIFYTVKNINWKFKTYSNTYQVTYRRIHASILIMAQIQTTTSSRRINNPRDAHDSLGMICTFMRKGLKEYGRIVNVTATSIRIERMQQTANGRMFGMVAL